MPFLAQAGLQDAFTYQAPDLLRALREIVGLRSLERAAQAAALIGLVGVVDRPTAKQMDAALRRLGNVIAGLERAASMLGRYRVVLMAESAARGQPLPPALHPVAPTANIPIPRVHSDEAVADLLTRHPLLAGGYKEVQEIYNEEHAFALARSADLKITEAVQRAVMRVMDTGQKFESLPEIRRLVENEVDDWNRGYAQTVLRTNMNSAYADGVLRQSQDPDVRKVIGALRFHAILDSNVRPNHRAAHGLVAAADDPVWQTLLPPLGYNCRCSALPVDWVTLKNMGLVREDGTVRRATVPIGARPDMGFGRKARPQVGLYVR